MRVDLFRWAWCHRERWKWIHSMNELQLYNIIMFYSINYYIIVQIHHTIHSMQVQEVPFCQTWSSKLLIWISFYSHKGDFTLNPSLFSSCFPVYQSKSEFVTLSFLLSVHTRTEVVIKVCKLRFHSLGKRVANEWLGSSKTPVNQRVPLDHFVPGGGRHAETHGSSRGWHRWLLSTGDSIKGPGLEEFSHWPLKRHGGCSSISQERLRELCATSQTGKLPA